MPKARANLPSPQTVPLKPDVTLLRLMVPKRHPIPVSVLDRACTWPPRFMVEMCAVQPELLMAGMSAGSLGQVSTTPSQLKY